MPASKTKKRSSAAGGKARRRKARARAAGRSRVRPDRKVAKARGKLSGNEIIASLKTLIRKDYTISDDLIPVVYRLLIGMVREALVEGRSVGFKNVGTMEPYQKAPQRYRHPKTQEIEESEPSTRVRFVISPNLKEDLNG